MLHFYSLARKTVAILLLLSTLTQGAPKEDLITKLPGLSETLPWKQYSGYLQASGSKKLHYWYLESANKPGTDPLVLWMNGGPGCSSDLGLMTEHGPFRVSSDGTQLSMNKYSWNNVANMLYLEAPAGVGFSYSDDQNYTTDDNIVAQDNFLAIQNFFKKFPELKSNEFFVTGESYGGVYVPTLSALVLGDSSINFQGMAVGNGITNYDMNDDSLLYFGYAHGIIGEGLWRNMILNCCQGNSTQCPFSAKARVLASCAKYVNEASLSFQGLNVYNLYAECKVPKPISHAHNGMLGEEPTRIDMPSLSFTYLPRNQKDLQMKRSLFSLTSGNLRLTPPCLDDTNVVKYLNTPEVRKALHIPGQVQQWDVCSSSVNFKYNRVYTDMTKFYYQMVNANKRVLVYNGDIDMACNFLGDEWFIEKLGLQVTSPRASWSYQARDGSKQVAGFIKRFKNLDLVTVRGAGHMVPQDKPIPALDMFSNFIFNK